MDKQMKEDAGFRDSYAVVERELRDEIERLTAEVSQLNADSSVLLTAIAEIAAQKLAKEMEMPNHADYHFAYEEMIRVARTASDTLSGSPTSEPTIIWMDSDDSWNKCSECDDELIDITGDGENGQRLECGKCGHEWWEGDYVQPAADALEQARFNHQKVEAEREEFRYQDERKDECIEQLEADITELLKFVNLQAEDDGLWFAAESASEAFIQQGLRSCHMMIEQLFADNTVAGMSVKAVDGIPDGEIAFVQDGEVVGRILTVPNKENES